MPRTAGPALAAPLMLVLILAAIMVFFIPLSPVLTVTFNISHSTNYPYSPTLTIVTWSYAKVSLGSSSGVTKGQIVLTYASNVTTQGQYSITLSVTYAGDTISQPTTFTPYGEATYQARVVYWPRSEQTSVPYVFTVSVAQTGFSPVVSTVTILPT